MTKTVEVELVNVPEFVKTRADERRSRIIGYILLALSGVVFGVFAFGVTPDAKSTFNLSLPTDAIQDLSISVNSRLFSTIMAVIILALGIDRLRARNLRWTNTALGVGLLAFVLAFLTWASADGAFNMVGMLRSTVISAVVITLGGLMRMTSIVSGSPIPDLYNTENVVTSCFSKF